jgi:hypothetical protein
MKQILFLAKAKYQTNKRYDLRAGKHKMLKDV